jgi:hypothetical protein
VVADFLTAEVVAVDQPLLCGDMCIEEKPVLGYGWIMFLKA